MNDFFVKNRRGLIGTLMFHVLAIVILVVCSFRTPLPLPEEQGILIDFGDSPTGIGDQDNSSSNNSSSSSNSGENTDNTDNETNIVQDYEASHNMSNTDKVNNNNSENTNNNNNNNGESENTNPNPLLNWGNNNNNGSNGNNGNNGDQGDPNGGNTNNYTGVTNVTDSELRKRPNPPCGVNVTGSVTIEVLINPQGKVTNAYQKEVINVIDQSQIDCVKKSAYDAEYKPISGNYTRRHLITFEFKH